MKIDIKEVTEQLTQYGNIMSFNAVKKLIEHYEDHESDDYVFDIDVIKRSWTEITSTDLMEEIVERYEMPSLKLLNIDFSVTPAKVVIEGYWKISSDYGSEYIYAIEHEGSENTYLFDSN